MGAGYAGAVFPDLIIRDGDVSAGANPRFVSYNGVPGNFCTGRAVHARYTRRTIIYNLIMNHERFGRPAAKVYTAGINSGIVYYDVIRDFKDRIHTLNRTAPVSGCVSLKGAVLDHEFPVFLEIDPAAEILGRVPAE